MARRRRRDDGNRRTTMRYVRIGLGVAFVVWIAIAFEIPLTTYGALLGTRSYSTNGTYTLHVPGIPPVRYSASIDYSVVGDFSVGTGNPIHMKATVYDANTSDFGNTFEAIDLLYQVVPFGGNGTVLLPYLHQSGPGTWTAQGVVEFARPINFTGPELVPTTIPPNSSLTIIDSQIISQVKAYNYSFPQLRPQSYTNSLSTREWELRLGAAVAAVVLLLLIPVFERILVPDRKQRNPGG